MKREGEYTKVEVKKYRFTHTNAQIKEKRTEREKGNGENSESKK